MGKLNISLACCDYDRCRALFDGRVQIEGCEVAATALEPEEAFHRAFKFQEFDVSELSLSSYTNTLAKGENDGEIAHGASAGSPSIPTSNSGPDLAISSETR